VSLEVVSGRDGRVYVIDGGPREGYDVFAVAEEPFAHYARKYEARRDLMHGRLEAPS
jgi:hypothetical protein